MNTYPVFSLAHLEHFEAVDAGALGNLSLNFILDFLGLRKGLVLQADGHHTY